METVYRYRFQGTIFDEREGFLSSADVGASFRYNLPGNYGDIQPASSTARTTTRRRRTIRRRFMVRGTVRPLRMHPLLRGLRFTGFYDEDAYVKNAERDAAIVAVTFEHPYVNAAFRLPRRRPIRRASAATEVDGRGWSVWVTPKPTQRLGRAVRFDHLERERRRRSKARRTARSPASPTGSRTRARLDGAAVRLRARRQQGLRAGAPTRRRFAVHALVNF